MHLYTKSKKKFIYIANKIRKIIIIIMNNINNDNNNNKKKEIKFNN